MGNTVVASKDKGRIFDKICLKLGWSRGSLGGIKKRARWQCTETPAVDSGSQAAYPVQVGDLAYDTTNKYAWICSVAPAAGTAASFIKLHA